MGTNISVRIGKLLMIFLEIIIYYGQCLLTPLPYFVLFRCGTLPYRQNKAVLGKFDCGVTSTIVFFVCVENKGIYWAFDGRYEFDNGDIV